MYENHEDTKDTKDTKGGNDMNWLRLLGQSRVMPIPIRHLRVLCVLCVFVVLRPEAAIGASAGQFVDHTGARHSWEISREHTLVWEGNPYVPAGVMLAVPAGESRSEGATEESKQIGAKPAGTPGSALPAAVSSALDQLVAHGVKDVCLTRSGGWLRSDRAVDQALVDGLEAHGLRYGIALDARPQRPLAGFMVMPTRIEVPADWMQPGRRLRWAVDLPGARAALYALVDPEGETVIAAGRVSVTDSRAQIEVALRPARRMFAPGPARLLVVPERELAGPLQEGPVDFWSGWEEMKQSLLQRLAAVKWGPGLRFFARPVAVPFGLRGEAEDLVPGSGGFRLQFESWLERRYSVADLSNQWALNDRQAGSLTVAARLVPLWGREEHGTKTGWFLDPITNEWLRADLRRCRFWRDLAQFRADSIREAVDGTALLIKKVAADVPVVWQWSEYHPLFTPTKEATGLDGLSFTPVNRGREAAVGSAAFAYAQAEESICPTWFVQLGQRLSSSETEPPASADELRLDWNWLREIGCKGFFLDVNFAGAPRDPDGAGRQGTSQVVAQDAGGPEASPPRASPVRQAPDSSLALDWIRDYAEKVLSGEGVAKYRPTVLYYPTSALGTSLTGRMDNGVWWLPSQARGDRLTLGDDIVGYWMEQPESGSVLVNSAAPAGGPSGGPARLVTVLWSTSGPRKATFVASQNRPVAVYDVTGRPISGSPRRGRVQLALDSTPTLITGLPVQDLFPVETTVRALHEFETLVKSAEAQKLPVASFRLMLNEAKTVFGPSTAGTVYQMIRVPLELLRAAQSPTITLEGEAATSHNWSSVHPDINASGGSLLRLDRAADPGGSAYQARWAFDVAREAVYEVWMAGSVPGAPDTAGFTWRVDEATPSLVLPVDQTRRFAPGLGWTRLGQVHLAAGRHTLVITATEPAPRGGYHLDVDELVLSREPFDPDRARRTPAVSRAP
jgi:hypothetical protein